MKKLLIATLLLITCLLSVSWAAKETKAENGWVLPEKAEAAVEAAVKKDRPVVFLYTVSEDGGRRTSTFIRSKLFKGMAKILVFADREIPRCFVKVAYDVTGIKYLPYMIVATPDLILLSCIKYNTTGTKLGKIVAKSRGIMKWRQGAIKEVKKADDYLEIGKYRAAKKIYEKTIKDDKKYSVVARRTWDEKTKASEITPVFFKDLDEKVLSMEGLAGKRYNKAKEFFKAEEYDKAIELLEPMVADKADYPIVKEASKLLKEIKAAKKKAPRKKPDKTSKKKNNEDDDVE